MTRARILASLLIVSACAAPLTPIAAQTARDTAHAKVVRVATDSSMLERAIVNRQVSAIRAADSVHTKALRVARDSITSAQTVLSRQMARIRAADSVLLRQPKITGLTCDSLAKVVAFNGAIGTTPEIQNAFATCKK